MLSGLTAVTLSVDSGRKNAAEFSGEESPATSCHRAYRSGVKAALDEQYTDQSHDGQDRREAVENPFTVRYMNFQIVHRMVNTVKSAP